MYEIYWSTATYYENFRKKSWKVYFFSTIDVKDSIRFEIILINAFAWFYILSDQKFLSGMKYLLKKIVLTNMISTATAKLTKTRLKILSVPLAAQWITNLTKWQFDNDFQWLNFYSSLWQENKIIVHRKKATIKRV